MYSFLKLYFFSLLRNTSILLHTFNKKLDKLFPNGIQWVMSRSVGSSFFIWRNWFGKHLSTIWNMAPACLMWLVWQECNTHIFEDKERMLDHLKSLLFGTLFHWTCIWGCTNCISIPKFLVSISFNSWLECI